MYSDFGNQLINMARYGFAFCLVYILWPLVLFRYREEGGLEGFMSRYAKMVCLTIAIVYILVIIKLYELISLVAVLVILSLYGIVAGGVWRSNPRELGTRIVTWIYDLLDGLIHPVKIAADWGRDQARSLNEAVYRRFGSAAAAGNTLLFAGVFLYAAYLRFYDAVMHAAPAMSDAYVTLAWMKYIEKRILFYDGIYPQGFHIYLSVLRKFATNDSLYILKYTGPLNGVLAALGVYFAVSRFTGRKVPGILAAFVYGVLGSYLPLQWERQASTNSQEFALVFLVPAWYFAANYLKSSKGTHLWAAGACFAVIGWVHSLIFAFLGIGLFSLLAAHLLLDFRGSLRPSWHICLAGAAAGALAALPVVVGLLMGRQFHGSSADFLTQDLQIKFPEITLLDRAALGGLLLFFVISFFTRKSRRDLVIPLFVLLLGASSFALYMVLGPMTGKAVLTHERTGILWSLLASMGIGLGWFAVFRLFPGDGKKQVAEAVLCLGLMACAVYYFKPAPVQPYKMQYDSTVDQYLRITEEFRPTEWMIVSNEEDYPLALGKGYHLMLGEFLNWYNPEDSRLARQVDGRIEVLSTTDIFIFKEKNMLRVDVKGAEKTLEARYRRLAREYEMLDRWIERYRATHSNMSIYYEDQNIQVFRIHQPKSREEQFRELWEGRENHGAGRR